MTRDEFEAKLAEALNQVFRDRMLRQGDMRTWIAYFKPLLADVARAQREVCAREIKADGYANWIADSARLAPLITGDQE